MTTIDIIENLDIKNHLPDFFIFNKCLPMLHHNSVSTSFNQDIKQTLGLDLEKEVMNSVSLEMFRGFMKDLFYNMDKSKFDYIDLRNITEYEAAQRLSTLLLSKNYKNIIASGRIGTLLQDYTGFTNLRPYLQDKNLLYNSTFYKIGKIDDINIYIDAYQSYTDDHIYLTNEIEANFEVKGSHVVNESTFTPRVIISFESGFNIHDSEKIYTIDETSKPERIKEFNKFMISVYRNEKIDIIIDK